jgi:hypothetical protein
VPSATDLSPVLDASVTTSSMASNRAF